MNVYDFDGTIYDGDSTVDFYLFALKHQPSLIRYLPRQFCGLLLFVLGRINKTQFKEYFFCYLPGIDAEELAQSFWKSKQSRIFDWYLRQKRPDDIIISASPEFLLKPICQRLGVNRLIASQVCAQTGLFAGENCRGEEKVRRLNETFGITHIGKFYSDSLSDSPLAKLADEAFLVKNRTIQMWVD